MTDLFEESFKGLKDDINSYLKDARLHALGLRIERDQLARALDKLIQDVGIRTPAYKEAVTVLSNFLVDNSNVKGIDYSQYLPLDSSCWCGV